MRKIILATLYASLLWTGIALAAVVVDINHASEQELMSLKGIGPVKARAIIENRQKNGPFRSVTDLDRVQGIGPKTVQRLGNTITVSRQEAGAEPPARLGAASHPGTVRAVPGYRNRWVNY